MRSSDSFGLLSGGRSRSKRLLLPYILRDLLLVTGLIAIATLVGLVLSVDALLGSSHASALVYAGATGLSAVGYGPATGLLLFGTDFLTSPVRQLARKVALIALSAGLLLEPTAVVATKSSFLPGPVGKLLITHLPCLLLLILGLILLLILWLILLLLELVALIVIGGPAGIGGLTYGATRCPLG